MGEDGVLLNSYNLFTIIYTIKQVQQVRRYA